MSITGTIRRNLSWLMLILVGLGVLGFMLMDSTQGSVGTKGEKIGAIGGKKITTVDLQNKQAEIAQRNPNIPSDQISEQAWNEIVAERALQPRYKSLGLNVPAEEMANLVKGPNPHPQTRRFFQPLMTEGNYDHNKVVEWIENLEDPNLIRNYDFFVQSLQKIQLESKYSDVLRNGVSAPNWLAMSQHTKDNKTLSFDFVRLPYTGIADNTIEITEDDLRDYAGRHASKFTAVKSRNIDYVMFPKVPSDADSNKHMIAMQELKNKFADNTRDSLLAFNSTTAPFATTGGEINPRMPVQTAESMNFPADIESQILNADPDEIIGPFKHNGKAFLIKVKERLNLADSAKVRHIVVNESDYPNARELRDSLFTVLQNNRSKFEEFVTEYSSDPGSKDKGGVYDYFEYGRFGNPDFENIAFFNKKGELGKSTGFYQGGAGYHIIEPLGTKGSKPAVKVFAIGTNFPVSEETTENLYRQAKEFERNSQTAEDFEKNAQAFGGKQTANNILPDSDQIGGIGEAREIVRWAFRADVDDVYYTNLPNALVVARLTNKTEDGDLDIVNQKSVLTNDVRKEKKAAQLIKKFNDNKAVDLQQLATNVGSRVQRATNAKFGASGGSIGFEPKVISRLFFEPVDEVVGPLIGDQGVYMVKITSVNDAPPPANLDQLKSQKTSQLQRNASVFAIVNAMKERGVIKDDRYKIR